MNTQPTTIDEICALMLLLTKAELLQALENTLAQWVAQGHDMKIVAGLQQWVEKEKA